MLLARRFFYGLIHLTGSVFDIQLVHRGILPEVLKRRRTMKKDAPYLRLVHDTRGGPTDREIEIIQQEADELG